MSEEAIPPGPVSTVSRLPLIAMGAVAVLVAFVALGLGLRGTVSYPADSPEAALQDFLQAALDGDEDDLFEVVAERRLDDCRAELDDYDRYGSGDVGFELDEMRVDGDAASATVTMRRGSGGDPFGSSYRFGEERFELRREADGWKIDEATFPWWLSSCLDGR